ncbi:MAG: tRNA (adenosine(37)-N6)-threonylcarbamoyltransferase complex dimerization subunit type 1 TsaB [Desulfitobacteriaceae bacterium]|nr:tRNA (adenosine(37)-N6)-threonylcarbamoyltransferase complex dimerization subunit type 1 TsaB [Desulfitobacteriaceae bacterium]MDD4345441.1 tRNA (adenosine(37)-N6)-threonylcarbamoyltransferase complex dimerization subunit type 1 TsaB [Desulfitobacteriaceae bacterium]MDD4400712.1 tRNA (adenosine(37)-N6)-threonylcarbamoyltransferase complex dimerization subunit type 1 TsaB [Desulfitobacteriaceae bacterium]
MKYLCIDTTTKVTALALAEDDQVVAEGFLHTNLNHSERLIPMLKQLVDAAAWGLNDLDMIGVVRGPGSFTGIRIGIATAQGLALVLKLPVLGVLSLDALAWAGYGHNGDIVPILDARKNEWYTARYSWNMEQGKAICLDRPCAAKPGEWLERLARLQKPIWFSGDAVAKAREMICSILGNRANFLPEFESLPRGAYVARVVWEKWLTESEGEVVKPYYIRLSEAEVNWRKRQQGRRNEINGG